MAKLNRHLRGLRKATARKRKRAIYTQTNKLVQEFGDVDGLERLAEEYVRKQSGANTADLIESTAFYNFLRNESIQFSEYEISWSGPLFRVTTGSYHPLSVAGSLAYGGRYNVGGAQVTAFGDLSGLPAAAVLYFGGNKQTALTEADTQRPVLYQAKPVRALSLWNINRLIENLNWASVKTQIEAVPWAANWSLQKCPKVSQILGAHLRSLGGDGFYCQSVKVPEGVVVGVFAADDLSAQAMFSIEQDTVPTQPPLTSSIPY